MNLKRAFWKILVAGGVALLSATGANASTMTYRFLIPAFGGDPNYFYVFKTEADAQNIYHAPPTPTQETTPLEDFKERLQYLILSQLATKIANAAFGEETINPGTYNIGNYEIQVTPTGTEIQVNLVDTTTGNTTTVEVPLYK